MSDTTPKPATEADSGIATDTESSVSWRLNELLTASRKAKAFATAEWFQPDAPEAETNFVPWTPEALGGERQVSEVLIGEELDDEPIAEADAAPDAELEAIEEELEETAPTIDQQALEQARQDSFDQGYQQAMLEAEQKWSGSRSDFVTLTDALRRAQSSTNDFYQPLKKLALHLAEQLVRGELTLATSAVERLVDAAIKDIEQQGEGPIVVSLSAADHEQFTRHLSSDLEHISLRIDPELSRGSVRISMDDSAVEDLIETRLKALSDKLLGLSSSDSAALSKSETFTAQAGVDGVIDDQEDLDTIIEGIAEELSEEELSEVDMRDQQIDPSGELSQSEDSDENPDA